MSSPGLWVGFAITICELSPIFEFIQKLLTFLTHNYPLAKHSRLEHGQSELL